VNFEELSIPGVWKAILVEHNDLRGSFAEWFKSDELLLATGIEFRTKQANVSFSKRGAVRGIHYSLASSGQDKWITCMFGSVMDFIVDLRRDSPTFGKWTSVKLNAKNPVALFISTGLGHAFVALEDNSCVSYLMTSSYSPSDEYGIHPLDPDIGIDWGFPQNELTFSKKDYEAPSFNKCIWDDLLPKFKEKL
jgi:dTDP-4-dehydrorhamnose 3,5-epimerase